MLVIWVKIEIMNGMYSKGLIKVIGVVLLITNSLKTPKEYCKLAFVCKQKTSVWWSASMTLNPNNDVLIDF